MTANELALAAIAITVVLVLGGGVVILALLFIRGWVENSARPLGEMRHEQTEWIDG